MTKFSWFELLLYILPVASILLVNRYGHPYLKVNKHMHLAVVDVIHPILWVCLHYLSLWTLGYSALPYVGLLISIIGLSLLAIRFRKGGALQWPIFGRYLSNFTFILTFVGYYALVIKRLVQVFK